VGILDEMVRHLRVATAVIPLAVAIGVRIALGTSPFTRTLIMATAVWLAVNVLAAPYSPSMQADIQRLWEIVH